MRIYNTLSEKKEELKKPLFRKLKLFVCGPTVYDTPHIGNARTFLAFDMIVRYLRSRGFKIFYLQNITNIDDKIIKRAADESVSWEVISQRYEAAFKQNVAALDITSVDAYARSTEFIQEIITQIETLITKGHVYKITEDVWYFDLTTYSDYGQLARRTISQAEDGVTRIDSSDKKRHVGDFCVWKFSKPNEPIWKADIGNGRPGWHIEDTATTEKFFGPQYDLHGGALDLKFPHHEAERALQESASGKKPFVKTWMHAGFLTVNGQKMSKSLGNFITVDDLLKKHSAGVFRMMLLLHHYRQPLDYTEDLIHQAKKNLFDLGVFLAKLDLAINLAKGPGVSFQLTSYHASYHKAMEDDFNTPQAMTVLFDLMNAGNKNMWRLNPTQAKKISSFIIESLSTLGIANLVLKVPEQVKKLAENRELSRTSKQFSRSDALRKEIETLGFVVEDTPAGPLVLPKGQ